MFFRQEVHFPQDEMQEISTRSPVLNVAMAEPTSSMTPMPSCPSMRPCSTSGTSPRRMCRSMPQMVVLCIRTMTSVLCCNRGSFFSGLLPDAVVHQCFHGRWFRRVSPADSAERLSRAGRARQTIARMASDDAGQPVLGAPVAEASGVSKTGGKVAALQSRGEFFFGRARGQGPI